MKQTTKKLAGLACGLALVLGCGAGTLTASATSVGDVIAHAYAVGLPESDIQACIAQYSGVHLRTVRSGDRRTGQLGKRAR